jgi:hypothetical protein
MQFQVPQFIDVEDRIFGPLTLRQFLYLAAAGALSFFLFFILTTKLWIGLTAVFVGIAAALAFVKINGQSLPVMAGYMLRFLWLPKFYIWRFADNSQVTRPQLHDLPSTTQSPLQKLLLKFHGGASTVTASAPTKTSEFPRSS